MILIKPYTEIDPGIRSGDKILNRLRIKANTCYKPEKVSPKSDYDFMWELVHNKKHTSVLRHEQASFKIVCSRGTSHQLVRHGLAHFLQESQRYCNYSNKNDGNVIFIIPHWAKAHEGVYSDDINILVAETIGLISDSDTQEWLIHSAWCEKAYKNLIRNGRKPEEAREVLSNSCKTELQVTANLEELRHIFKQRASPHADGAMQHLMYPLLEEFKKKIPVVFDDL